MRRWRHIRTRRGAFFTVPPPPAVIPPAIPQMVRPAGQLRFAARLTTSRGRRWDPPWPQGNQGQPWPSFTRQAGTRARFATRQSRGRWLDPGWGQAPQGPPVLERQLVRNAVARYFGGALVTSDAGTCYQGGPLTAFGLGTAYPYSVKGVPDEYYQAGQPPGQGWGAVMSTTRVRRTSVRDSYGGATSGFRARKYAIDCQLEVICELPHIEVAGAGLDNLIDEMHALIAADRNLGTKAAYSAGASPLLILQAGEGKGGQGGPGITDETDRFEEIDHDRGRYRGTAAVSFECLTMVVG